MTNHTDITTLLKQFSGQAQVRRLSHLFDLRTEVR